MHYISTVCRTGSGTISIHAEQSTEILIKINSGSSVSATNLYSIWKPVENFIVESLRQAYEVCTTCKLSVQSFTFVMTDSANKSLHFPIKILLN